MVGLEACRAGIVSYEQEVRAHQHGLNCGVVEGVCVKDVVACAEETVMEVEEDAAIHRAAHIPYVEEVDTYQR
jgi:hypothetical protein